MLFKKIIFAIVSIFVLTLISLPAVPADLGFSNGVALPNGTLLGTRALRILHLAATPRLTGAQPSPTPGMILPGSMCPWCYVTSPFPA